MIKSHLLYQLSYPCVAEIGIEPMSSGFSPTLSMSYSCMVFVRRNTKPDTGPRQSGLREPEHMANAKERAHKASAEQLQET